MHPLKTLILTAAAALTASAAHAAYDLPYIGDQIVYEAKHEDTFVHLARDYNLGFTEMRAANPYIDPWIPGKGTDIIMPMRHLFPDAEREGIVINLAEMRLFGFMDKDKPVTFPIGVGREGLDTPMGKTTVTRKKEGPTWTPTARMRKEDPELKPYYPPGADNPLGTHALYLGWPTYAIHGTNRPFGIGRRVSSGCIRMYPETITQLFDMVPVGTPVQIVNQPIKLAWIDNKLYLEAHPTLEQSIDFEEKGVSEEQKLTDAEMKYLIEVAGEFQDRLNWPEIRTSLKERKGYPIHIARRPAITPEDTIVSDAESALDIAGVTEKLNAPIDDVVEKQKKETLSAADTHRAIKHSLNN
jgi:L,D-transpeptidase ErfK/SrfK